MDAGNLGAMKRWMLETLEIWRNGKNGEGGKKNNGKGDMEKNVGK